VYKKALVMFAISFLVLGYLGTQPATPSATIVARIFTAMYFGFFLLMPIYTRWERTKPVPTRVTEHHSLDEQLPALFEEITELKPETGEPDHGVFRSSFFSRRPNPTGIRHVLTRFAKKLVESLD
jgi:ubiquinol-cytochrome c reductase cytochrome b subunit